MNARPYIFGCLCLVGATGTAAASDIAVSRLLSLGGAVVSSFDSGNTRSSSGNRDGNAGDVMSTRPGSASQHGSTPAPAPSPTDAEDSPHDGPAPMRSPAPSWQSLLPGSML